MAAPLTLSTDISSTLAPAYLEKRLIEILEQRLVFRQFGLERPLPKGQGKTLRFNKFAKLAIPPAALTEGTTPTGSTITSSSVDVVVEQWGDWTKITDLAEMTSMVDVVSHAADVLGIQASETIDSKIRDVIVAGTVVQYASTATSRVTVSAAMTLTTTELREALRTLEVANAPTFDDGRYVAVIHPRAAYDFRGDANFVNADQYAGSKKLFNGELGEWLGIRIVSTTNASVFTGAGAGGVDVYAAMILGKGAYAVTDLQSLETYIRRSGAQDTSNPLNLYATCGWKVTFKTVILDNARMVRIEHGVTA